MKVKLLGFAATLSLMHSISAHSALVELDIRASGEWYRQYEDVTPVNEWDPYYYQLEVPELFGTILVDNTRSDMSALIEANFYFGSHHWTGPFYGTEGMMEDGNVFRYNADGSVRDFVMPTPAFSEFGVIDANTLGLESHGFSEMNLGIGDLEWYFCHQNCFTITQTIDGVPVVPVVPISDVPEPASLALLGLGGLGMVFARRRNNKKDVD